jgi:hypothetical protein
LQTRTWPTGVSATFGDKEWVVCMYLFVEKVWPLLAVSWARRKVRWTDGKGDRGDTLRGLPPEGIRRHRSEFVPDYFPISVYGTLAT